MMKRKLKGFTLIELIVVIAIIGILSAILIPTILGYIRQARVARFNSNAKSVFSGAQLAITDVIKMGRTAEEGEIYICKSEGSGLCVSSNGDTIDITDYIGTNFSGWFGFKTDSGGSGTLYAVWSEQQLTAGNFPPHLTMDDVKSRFDGNGMYVGCYPLIDNT